jgi:hypothetical protein
MPACAFCGVNMTTAEVTQRPYDGVVGNYHRDCAYMEYLYNSGPVQSQPTAVQEVNSTWRTKLRERKAQQAASPAAPSGALTSGTALGIGAYKYAVTFVDAYGESLPGSQFSITTTSGNQNINLSAIPTGPAVTTKRNIYRTTVGGTQLKLVGTLNDNTTTTFSDNKADGSLGTNAPTVSTFAQADFP